MLSRCGRIFGGTTILDAGPRFDVFEDVLCVPSLLNDGPDGCYDRARRLLPASGMFRGVPELHLLHGRYVSDLDPLDHPFAADGPDHVLLGHVMTHYGHFLVATLSRLWHLLDAPPGPDLRLVYWAEQDPAALFAIPFIAEIMGLLGVAPHHLLRLDSPTRIRRLRIPSMAFEENILCHRLFATVCNALGDRMEAATGLQPSTRPAYLAKSRVATGVSRIVNEDALCDRLALHGIDIVYPEAIPLAAQAMMFRERPVMLGTTGSALHTGIFSPGNRIAGLSYGDEIWSNQILLDRANRNVAQYLYPQHDLINEGRSAAFHNNFRLTDPAATADQYARVVDAFLSSQSRPPLQTRTALLPPPPPGRLLSTGRPTMQSSVCIHSGSQVAWEDSAGAVSGQLTGTGQFHTDIEPQPWWQVDLGRTVTLSGIRLFNRLDGVAHRSAALSLLGSADGIAWETLATRDDPAPFGGLDGHPYDWRPALPCRARFVRVRLTGEQYLHLDQVQVFGW